MSTSNSKIFSILLKKGHRLQVQIQSTWFPLIDLNPQTYVDNIFEADEEGFKTQTHTVFTDSSIEFWCTKKIKSMRK